MRQNPEFGARDKDRNGIQDQNGPILRFFVGCPIVMIHQMHADLDEAHRQDEVNHSKSPGWKLLRLVVPHDQHEDHNAGSDKLSTGLRLNASGVGVKRFLEKLNEIDTSEQSILNILVYTHISGSLQAWYRMIFLYPRLLNRASS